MFAESKSHKEGRTDGQIEELGLHIDVPFFFFFLLRQANLILVTG